MSNSISAIIIAAIGVLGTLAAAIVSPLLAGRARLEDFNLQRLQREEEYTHQQQEAERASKRSCYISMMATARHYRLDLMFYLELAKKGEITSSSRSDIENSRRACLTSLAEVGLVAPRRVLATIDPVNNCLAAAYHDIRQLEADEARLALSSARINQSLTDLYTQLQSMGNAMRSDLTVKD